MVLKCCVVVEFLIKKWVALNLQKKDEKINLVRQKNIFFLTVLAPLFISVA